MTFLRFTWCVFVSWLVLRTYGFDPVDYQRRRRELADAYVENDRLRVAFVRAQELIRRMKHEAATWPSTRAAHPVAEDLSGT